MSPPSLEKIRRSNDVREEVEEGRVDSIRFCPVLSKAVPIEAPPLVVGGEGRMMIKLIPAACFEVRCGWWNVGRKCCGVATVAIFSVKGRKG